MDDYDRQGELQDLVDGLDSLIDNLDSYKTDFEDDLRETMMKAQGMLDEVNYIISQMEAKEMREQEREYWEGVI